MKKEGKWINFLVFVPFLFVNLLFLTLNVNFNVNPEETEILESVKYARWEILLGFFAYYAVLAFAVLLPGKKKVHLACTAAILLAGVISFLVTG